MASGFGFQPVESVDHCMHDSRDRGVGGEVVFREQSVEHRVDDQMLMASPLQNVRRSAPHRRCHPVGTGATASRTLTSSAERDNLVSEQFANARRSTWVWAVH